MIQATVGLPIYKGKDIAWLCLESLCRQKTSIGWELIVVEEKQHSFGEEEVSKYVNRLMAAGCERVCYVELDYKISLPDKWKSIANYANSDVFVFCSADDYHEPNKIQASYEAITGGHDWICYNNYLMYCIKTKRYIQFDAKSINWQAGALKACRTSDLKTIPNSELNKGVDRYIFKSINPKNILVDTSESWKQGFCTDGFNVISKERARHFTDPEKPFFKTDLNIDGFPKEVLNRLNHLTQRKEFTEPKKVVAVIPVHGRLPLLKHTIQRLYNKNGCFKVICVGSELERDVCEKNGAEFVLHSNNPLGAKWNAGFMAAKKHNPTACLFVGSSDWVSDNWLQGMNEYDYDLIGKKDFYMLDIGDKFRACHWKGYTAKERANEPIGIGRMLSRNILEQMDWQPMDGKLNSSLDWSMFQKVKALGGNIILVEDETLKSLSVSTDKWDNMHKFNEHYTGKLKSDIINVDELLNEFPEGKMIFQ